MTKMPSGNRDRDGNAGDSDEVIVMVMAQASGGWQASGSW
jgi:hypothetical protein